MKLHLGCGGLYLPGFINIDFMAGEEGVKADQSWDLRKPLDMYESDSAELIIANHLLEHLPINSVEGAVASWYRVLKPGGVLVMELPNFDAIVGEYFLRRQLNRPIDDLLPWIFGNQEHQGQFHYWGWSQDSLTRLFEKIGIKNYKFMKPQDREQSAFICLRVEITK